MRKRIALMTAIAAPAVVYFWTVCPTVYGGDSGELATAAYFLGIVHPPGYPLWVMLGKLFTLIPVGDVAFRVNLMSALLTALGIGVVFLLSHKITGFLVPSLVGSLAVAFSAIVWTQATFAEVYCLSFLLFAVFAYFTAEWIKEQKTRSLYALCLFYGFLLTAHQSAILFLPLLLVVLVVIRRPTKVSALIGASLFFLGLSPFLYIPLCSAGEPVIDWPGNDTFGGFIRNLLRMNWGEIRQNPYSLRLFLNQGVGYGSLLAGSLTIPVLIVSILGFLRMFVRRRNACLLLAGAVVSLLGGISFLVNPTSDPAHLYQISFFLLPLSALLAVWIAEALGTRQGALVKYALAGCLIVSVPLVSNYGRCDKRNFFLAREYGESILFSLPPNSVLFTDGDNETFILGYLKKVEGMRPDVHIYNRKGYFFDDIYELHALPRCCWPERQAEVEAQFLTGNAGPVFFTNVPCERPHGFRPTGLVYLAVKEGEETAVSPGTEIVSGWEFTPEEVLQKPSKYDFITRKFCITPYEMKGETALSEMDYERALHHYRQCAEIGYDFPEARYNRGLLEWANGDFVAAVGELAAAAALEPVAAYPDDKLYALLSFETASGGAEETEERERAGGAGEMEQPEGTEEVWQRALR